MFSTQEIMADWETLLRQAPMTADLFLGKAIRNIDDRLGEGYAAKHPELVAAMIAASSQDFHSASMGIAAQKIAAAIEGGAVDEA